MEKLALWIRTHPSVQSEYMNGASAVTVPAHSALTEVVDAVCFQVVSQAEWEGEQEQRMEAAALQ